MAKQRVKFTFPQELITLPIIYELGKQFSIITNVRRADVTEDRGWVVLEMDGPIEEIERASSGSPPRASASTPSRATSSKGLGTGCW